MPSPIAHSAAGYVLYRCFRHPLSTAREPKLGPWPVLLGLAVFVSLLPDVDAVVGILAGSLGRFHNNASHSLAAGLALGVAAGIASLIRAPGLFRRWFLFAFIGYEFHILMDLFTVGKGVMLLWPLTTDRFSSPVPLFYGLHWSDGWLSVRHLWTVLSESAFFLAVAVVTGYAARLRSAAREPSR